MAVADASGLPIAAHVQSASPHEVKLVEATIGSRFVSAVPDRLIADKAYDSDELDHRLQLQMGIELIAPHRGNRKSNPAKMGANSDATNGAGKSSGSLPGCKTSGA